MSFPSDIKNAMKECILNLLWAKKDIISFFENNGCTKQDLSAVKNYEESGLSRAAIVGNMFSHLSARSDEGLGQFRAMLKSLIEWSHFDSYYFDKLRKLDREKANRSIEHLKQLQEIRDHKIKQERERREKDAENANLPKIKITELKQVYLSLMQQQGGNQERGYRLEKILQELSRLSGLEVTEPFRVNGEQIDGAIKYDGEHYLIEAKWQDKASSNEPVYQFAGKVEGKMYGRGLFISVNGFSESVITSLVTGKAIKTIFVDGQDLMLVLEEFLTLRDLIDRKVKAAQTKGQIYIHPISGDVKGG